MMRPPDQPLPERGAPAKPWRFWLRAYGDDSLLTQEIAEKVRAWDASGRPRTESMHLRAFPAKQAPAPLPDEFAIPRRWTTILVRWSG